MKKANKMTFASVLKQIFNRYDEIHAINLSHQPNPRESGHYVVSVHTPEAESYELWLDELVPDEKVCISVGGDAVCDVSVSVLATYDTPGIGHGKSATMLYRSDAWADAPSRSIEDGLQRLEKKYSGVCPECDTEVESLSHHQAEHQECNGHFE